VKTLRNKNIIIGAIAAALLVGGYAALRSVVIEKEHTVVQNQETKLTDNDFKINNQTVNSIDLDNIEIKEGDFKGNRNLYCLNLALSSEEKKLRGYEVVKFKNNYKANLTDVVFHLYADSYNKAETKPSIGGTSGQMTKEEIGDIKINSVKFNGKSVKYNEDNQILKFSLDNQLKPGEEAEIAIDFTLKIPRSVDRLGYTNEQYSLTNWYPILSIYDEKAGSWDETPFHPVGESNYSDSSDYKVNIAVPKDMVVTGTGVNTSKKSENNMDKLSFEALNNRDFVLFMSKDYKVVSTEIDGIKVNSYYFKEKSTAERMLGLAAEALKFYNEVYGKYPFPEYDVVETYLQGGAMEYPTATQMGPYMKMDSDYKQGRLTFFDEAVVHETAHQWFYSTIGNNEFKEPVLDETFTSYATALFFEKKFGEYSQMGVKAAFLTRTMKASGPIYRTTDKYTWNDFGLVVYKIGPVVLEDLRQKVGEEKFIDIFKTYYDKYKYKNASLEGFLEIIKEKCGEETSSYVRNAFTSSNYLNKSIIISEDELDKIKNASGK
jgi:aminopeptidase N